MIKRIIDGITYNTDTATRVVVVTAISPGPDWEDTALYQTRSGHFFLAGQGGPGSRWGVAAAGRAAEGIEAIGREGARHILLSLGHADVLASLWGGDATSYPLRLPPSLKDAAAAMASVEKTSLNALIVRAIERYLAR